MKQLDDILYFSNLSNKKKIIISGIPQRQEYDDIPKMALREAICNCYCHRDYSLSGDIKVEFYDDKVMIFSPGSLPDGLTLEDIKNGMTAKRNQIIVNALDKVDFIENYASGVRRIFKDYETYDKKPEYKVSDNGVILSLYNRNYIFDTVNDTNFDTVNDTNFDTNTIGKNVRNRNNYSKKLQVIDRHRIIINKIKENPQITSEILSKEVNVSLSTIKRDLNKLKKENKIARQGTNTDGEWIIID